MLTLALTGTVPETVCPEAGDVIVTIRLPPGSGGSICANAWGAIQATPKTINRAAAQTFLFVFFSVERVSIRPASLSFPRVASFATYRSLFKDDQFGSRNDIERVYQDPEIARKRV